MIQRRRFVLGLMMPLSFKSSTRAFTLSGELGPAVLKESASSGLMTPLALSRLTRNVDRPPELDFFNRTNGGAVPKYGKQTEHQDD